MDYILVHPDAKEPAKKDGDDNNAGWDLFTPNDFDLLPGERRTIDTGFACELPLGKWALILDTSKLANHFGVTTLAGVIENNYRGTWGVVLLNTGFLVASFKTGEKIAQFVLLDQVDKGLKFNRVEKLSTSIRGSSGIWDRVK